MFVAYGRRCLKSVSFLPGSFSLAFSSTRYTKINAKKRKFAAVEPGLVSPPSVVLSPEQLEKIARNKQAALEKRSSAQTPPGFGAGWRKSLSAEFGKPYFRNVSSPATIHTGDLQPASIVWVSYNRLLSCYS